ncbi:MAG: rRNA small subunit methyltransferase B, partial [Actinomycetota bacterium]|nr:rRNA small subunit methyltransferase B [Actinomycetota bacterium]
DPARRAAYDVLSAVRERDAYANLVLPGLLRERRLSGRDAALATELAYGTLRAQGTLDAILAHCVDRPLDTLDGAVRDLLRLGAYQLLRTRVPSHAAVSATVDLARTVTSAGPAKLVNAVLRKVGARDDASWLDLVTPPYGEDPVGSLAMRHGHPRWIAQAFRDTLDGDLEQTAAALAADDIRPQVHLAARPGQLSQTELAAASGGEPGPWSPLAVRLDGGDPHAIAAVRDGRAQVQDEGSQLVTLALAGAPIEGADTRWLDLCAGPGGKAALLGGLAAQRDARLTAVEPREHRAALVRQAVAGLPVDVRVADGREMDGVYDRVLVDAPCTGLGALRRRPDARWRRQPADVPDLTRLQRELLTAALRVTRPGGVVAYTVCSPHVAETRVVVDDIVRRGGGVLLDARAALPGVPDLGAGPWVQLWPHRHGTDAMFLALLTPTRA